MGRNDHKIKLLQAENGSPTALFRLPESREIFLHSRFDPEAEARFLIEDVPIKEHTLYVVLGFGLGYHVKALLERIPPSSHILVVEPATEHISAQSRVYHQGKNDCWLDDDRLSFHTHYDPETVPMFLADAFIRLRVQSLNLYMHIPSASTNEAFYSWLSKEIQQKFPVYLEGNLGANDRTLENNLSNYWANLPHTWQASHISCLKQGWRDRPIILVAAGPSLSAELEHLRRVQAHALILCVGTAAPILLENGVSPHYVVSVDPFEANMSHFTNWNNGHIPLIYYHRIWRGILPEYSGPKFWFAMDDEPPIPLTGINRTKEFWRGGTVSFTALQIAHYLKADPIILIGLDFAYLDGRMHAEEAQNETLRQAESLPEGFFRIPGISGEQVVTNINYYSYLLYVQDYIQRHPHVRHINTSRTGAKIHGTIEMPFKQLIEDRHLFENANIRKKLCNKAAPFEGASLNNDMFDLVRRWDDELAGFLDSNNGEKRLKKLLSDFKRLSVYREISDAYDRCFHTWEIKKLRNQSESEQVLCERLLNHCRIIQSQFQDIFQSEKVLA